MVMTKRVCRIMMIGQQGMGMAVMRQSVALRGVICTIRKVMK
jgi:hypothetical protein